MSNDIVADIFARVAAASAADPLSADILRRLEKQIRHDWGGDRVYISRYGLSRSQRIEDILRDWRNGERVDLLARRYEITERRVWQIVSAPQQLKKLKSLAKNFIPSAP